ncbi:caffeic acid 3-O-methyltransferase-like [Curcuma longa]|uniref:caffeic acid 3-O-methyltransferase-like n=1 Tax=Curcuma longa TaxID=136217 RepID=UPI003D9E7C1D
MVDRLLRLLAAHGIVTCVTDAASRSRKYAASPVSKYLIVEADGTGASSSMADLALLFQDKSVRVAWEHVKDLVLHGVAAVTRAEVSFDDLGSDSQIGKAFHNAMAGYSSVIVKQLLPIYHGFDDVEVLVDVGGGNGTCLSLITAAHPHVKGINFDIQPVISQAPPIPGVEHVSGDMFESVPPADAIFMKWILHDWGDEECVKILKNCWKVLPENGKVMVVECLLPAITEQTVKARAVLQMDMGMMACFLGGKERSEEEFKALASEAGFQGFKIAQEFAGTWVVMELTK